jgi:hypothetical protein
MLCSIEYALRRILFLSTADFATFLDTATEKRLCPWLLMILITNKDE